MRLRTWIARRLVREQRTVVGRFKDVGVLTVLSLCGVFCLSGLLETNYGFAMMLERELVEDLPIQRASQRSQILQPGLGETVHQGVPWTLFDIYLDEDRPFVKGALSEDLEDSIDFVRHVPAGTLLLETYCDRRGSRAYSLALGHRRAIQLQEFLQNLQIPHAHIQTSSYGNENPQCRETSRRCWEENVRMQSTFRYIAIKESKLGCLGRLRMQGRALSAPSHMSHRFLQKIHLAPK
ncbi:OmpA family protein [Nitrospira sp. M1]